MPESGFSRPVIDPAHAHAQGQPLSVLAARAGRAAPRRAHGAHAARRREHARACTAGQTGPGALAPRRARTWAPRAPHPRQQPRYEPRPCSERVGVAWWRVDRARGAPLSHRREDNVRPLAPRPLPRTHMRLPAASTACSAPSTVPRSLGAPPTPAPLAETAGVGAGADTHGEATSSSAAAASGSSPARRRTARLRGRSIVTAPRAGRPCRQPPRGREPMSDLRSKLKRKRPPRPQQAHSCTPRLARAPARCQPRWLSCGAPPRPLRRCRAPPPRPGRRQTSVRACRARAAPFPRRRAPFGLPRVGTRDRRPHRAPFPARAPSQGIGCALPPCRRARSAAGRAASGAGHAVKPVGCTSLCGAGGAL